MAQTHRSMAYFPVLTGRDEMSKQARFIIRMALACHEAGTPYSVEWKRDHPTRMAATLTATGNIPMPKPFPKAPKMRTTATWKPNVFAEASYRMNVGLDRERKEQAGWIVEHSSGLSLVKFGQSETGELAASDECDPMDGWHLTHTASLKGWGVHGKLKRMVSALLFSAPFMDWQNGELDLAKHPDWQRIGLTIMAEYGPYPERDRQRLAELGGPVIPLREIAPKPELPASDKPARTRTAPAHGPRRPQAGC